ncbi:MAG: ABZJ_00895 family protein [Pseudomonadota bacterium]
MSSDEPVGQQPVLPFIKVFALCYLGLTLVVFLLTMLTPLQGNAGFAAGALIGSATLAAQKFHADIGRPPLGMEVIRLSVFSFGAVLLLSVPLTVAALTASGIALSDIGLTMQAVFGPLTGGEIATIVGFTVAIHLLVLWLSYGPLARLIARNSRR